MNKNTYTVIGVLGSILIFITLRDIDITESGNQFALYIKLIFILSLPLTLSFITNWRIAEYVGDKSKNFGYRITSFILWLLLNAIAVLMIFDVFKKMIASY